jgi:hypothetical protein
MRTRKRPAPTDRPLRDTTTSAAKGNGHRRKDGYAAPTREDRADDAVLAAVYARCPGCARMHAIHPCFPGCGVTS